LTPLLGLHRASPAALDEIGETIMKIGFIGASTVAQTIAKHVLPFGHQVMLSNSRGPDSLADNRSVALSHDRPDSDRRRCERLTKST
jgi:NADP oxidoreductase coenzyme F420-dependent